MRDEGDCYARFGLLLDQVKVSLDVAGACVDRLRSLAAGPVNVRLPKLLKVPEGATYCWTENPLGINGYYLVSRGEKTPWRMKLRSASFNNIAVLPEVLRAVWSRTWSRSWARCSSWSATSTDSRRQRPASYTRGDTPNTSCGITDIAAVATAATRIAAPAGYGVRPARTVTPSGRAANSRAAHAR